MPSTPPPDPIMTVEQFLRIPTSRRETTELSNIRPLSALGLPVDPFAVSHLRLRSRLLVKTGSPAEESSSEHSDSPKSSSEEEMTIPKRRRKNKRPFKKRIYEAAIATGVQPTNSIVQPEDTPLSKPPLSFEPISPPRLQHKRSNILVPDRRYNPFRKSDFIRPVGKSKPRLPITRWQTCLPALPTSGHRETSSFNTKVAADADDGENRGQTPIYPPLLFVPLTQAEEGYKTMFTRLQQ